MRRVTEPTRKSLLDVVQENLRAAGRGSHISRVAYIGEYIVTPEELRERMSSNIKELQTDYSDIQISGLLLVYPRFYVHVLEVLEDIVYKHFKTIYESTMANETFGKAIILPTYHHVHQRFFAKWYHAYTIPPSLLEKPGSTTLADIQNQMSNCLTKIYGLCNYMLGAGFNNASAMHDILENLGERVSRLLPESTLLEYLLSVDSPVLHTIEDYVKMHSAVPYINLYNESIWPPPRDTMLSGVQDRKGNADYQPITTRIENDNSHFGKGK